MEAATARFIEGSTALPSAVLAALYEDSLDRWSRGGRDASRATRVSASENSAIERAVRTALLRRTHELDAFRPHICFDIKPACSIAARAVCKRTKLTEGSTRCCWNRSRRQGSRSQSGEHRDLDGKAAARLSLLTLCPVSRATRSTRLKARLRCLVRVGSVGDHEVVGAAPLGSEFGAKPVAAVLP